ncbi:MAG: hypothetical protein EB104_04995 [Acidimicrobiia bacterium]|nr:hypothetical protein [Acidimicrobiia bacterium]
MTNTPSDDDLTESRTTNDDAPVEPAPQLPDDAHMVRRAAQRYGTVGAMLAGGMVAFDRLLGRKPKEEPAVVIEASSEPEDIEKGISLTLEQPDGETLDVFAPPPGRRRARAHRRRRRSDGQEA